VAAVIASGAPDVATGVRATASFGLASVTLGEGSYYARCGTRADEP
jgi:hypothetical protein